MYPIILIIAFYSSFLGLVVLVYPEIQRMRGMKITTLRVAKQSARIEQIVVALTTWFKSVCAVGMFKISASLHASTARLTSHLYRRASVSREKAQVSTL
ncbi:MAG: hypothetical protein Q8P93_04615, partial [bacterium]|nr:hypothetical protein [bacterium]